MTRFRPFKNSDPPALTRLWNEAVPSFGSGAAYPLRVHELDSHAWGTVNFDPRGLIVAERDDRIVGYVHAGFGPDQPIERTLPFEVCRDLGTICLMILEPELRDPELGTRLILEAERYLAQCGAKVIYAGNLCPLNPFYWGLHGGSEGGGIVAGDVRFHRSLRELGYEPVSTAIHMRADLNHCEPRDPRAHLIRRQTQLEFVDDAMPSHWWEGLALGDFQIMKARLIARCDGTELARAATWDMSWFSRVDDWSRIGLIDVEVAASHRRKGFGRFLVAEILRRARENLVAMVELQTMSTNAPALALYHSLGFEVVDQSTFYRLPGHLHNRFTRMEADGPSELGSTCP